MPHTPTHKLITWWIYKTENIMLGRKSGDGDREGEGREGNESGFVQNTLYVCMKFPKIYNRGTVKSLNCKIQT